MTYFEAYLLTRLDGLGFLLFILGLLAVVMTIAKLIIFANYQDHCPDDEKQKCNHKSGRAIRRCFFIIVALVLIGGLTPTTKQAAFIYIAPAIVNNQDIQKTIKKLPELSGLGLEYLGEILKEEIKETKKEVINSVK